jgi:hypothetical protein
MDMNMCFVIQPFDNGKFDQRYEESFAPAIEKANLEPYRVDKDLGTQIPIDDIDAKMKQSSIVFADITLDNPNVWFEVGLAIAYRKKIVLVCSTERVGDKFPFDIQHRVILKYNTSSKGDYEKLESNITEKLKSLMSRKEMTTIPESKTGVLPEKDISDESLNLLGIIGQNVDSFNGSVAYGQISMEMKNIGYNNLATNLAVNELQTKKLIAIGEENDWNSNEYTAIRITEEGSRWIEKNKARFNLSFLPVEAKKAEIRDNRIPF